MTQGVLVLGESVEDLGGGQQGMCWLLAFHMEVALSPAGVAEVGDAEQGRSACCQE